MRDHGLDLAMLTFISWWYSCLAQLQLLLLAGIETVFFRYFVLV